MSAAPGRQPVALHLVPSPGESSGHSRQPSMHDVGACGQADCQLAHLLRRAHYDLWAVIGRVSARLVLITSILSKGSRLRRPTGCPAAGSPDGFRSCSACTLVAAACDRLCIRTTNQLSVLIWARKLASRPRTASPGAGSLRPASCGGSSGASPTSSWPLPGGVFRCRESTARCQDRQQQRRKHGLQNGEGCFCSLQAPGNASPLVPIAMLQLIGSRNHAPGRLASLRPRPPPKAARRENSCTAAPLQ